MSTENKYPFFLEPLPYPYDALEPHIDTETMHYHHDKHLKTYVNNLNDILSNYLEYQNWTLEELLENLEILPVTMQEGIKNNGGGVYNHNLYFQLMTPHSDLNDAPILKAALEQEFDSIENFQTLLTEAGLKRFGSGYAWLIVTTNKKLAIISTANQFTPLSYGLMPILLVDVWEHAYYLKYKNERNTYLKNWFYLINWKKAQEQYEHFMKQH